MYWIAHLRGKFRLYSDTSIQCNYGFFWTILYKAHALLKPPRVNFIPMLVVRKKNVSDKEWRFYISVIESFIEHMKGSELYLRYSFTYIIRRQRHSDQWVSPSPLSSMFSWCRYTCNNTERIADSQHFSGN